MAVSERSPCASLFLPTFDIYEQGVPIKEESSFTTTLWIFLANLVVSIRIEARGKRQELAMVNPCTFHIQSYVFQDERSGQVAHN